MYQKRAEAESAALRAPLRERAGAGGETGAEGGAYRERAACERGSGASRLIQNAVVGMVLFEVEQATCEKKITTQLGTAGERMILSTMLHQTIQLS